jgi:hypothetical protein
MPTIVGVLAPDQHLPSGYVEHITVLPAHADVHEILNVVQGTTMWWPGDI